MQHRPARHGLAGAALADQAHDLSLAHREGDAIDRADDAATRAEFDRKILDFQERHGQSFAPRISANPSARKLNPTARNTMARPGKSEIHQAWAMKLLPSAIMMPHS